RAELGKRVANPGKAGLATFAAAARIYHPVENHPKFQESLAKPEDRGETSIEKALLLAREAMPTDTVNRVVLFTDGNETTGDALSAAKRIAAHGIRVYPVPYEADEKDEILLEDLVVPAEVKRGQSFTISAAAHATAPGKAMFTLYRDGFKI